MSGLDLWLATAVVVLASAAVQSMTGFGFAVLAVPLLALFWKPVDAVAISMALSTLCVAVMWPGLRRAERLPIILPLGAAALIGLPIGVWSLQRLDLHALRLAIGAVAFTTVAIFGFGALRNADVAAARTPRPVFSLATGLAAGVLTGSLSMPGPPVVMLLTASRAPKTSYRATLTAFAVLVYPFGLGAMLFERLISPAVLLQVLLQAPVLVAGVWAGHRLHGAVSERAFALFSLGLLGLAGGLCFVSR